MGALPREPKIITFGCRLNAYESEVMRTHALSAGLGDAVIVNTCMVTAEAERQGRQAIRRARREHPEARLIVTGCAAQIDPARYAAMPEVDRVLGNEEKLKAESFVPGDAPRVAVNDIMSVRETAAHLIDGFAGRTRAFVQSSRAATTAARSASSPSGAATAARCPWARWSPRCARSPGAASKRSCCAAWISPPTAKTCRVPRASAN